MTQNGPSVIRTYRNQMVTEEAVLMVISSWRVTGHVPDVSMDIDGEDEYTAIEKAVIFNHKQVSICPFLSGSASA